MTLIDRLQDPKTEWQRGDPCYLILRTEAADRIRKLEAVVKFCHDIAEEEYPHQERNVGAELVLRHIIRKCSESAKSDDGKIM